MRLHPFKSRKQRLANALTASALFAVLVGMMVLMTYDGNRFRLEYLLLFLPVGLIGLISYVRGNDRK